MVYAYNGPLRMLVHSNGIILAGSLHDPRIIVCRRRTNLVPLEVRIVPYGGGLRLLLAQDVSRLEKVERMRRDFVANVSHELRTPLTVLRGDLETLMNASQEIPQGYLGCLERIEKQSIRMQYLDDGLLMLTRLEYGSTNVEDTRIGVEEMLIGICQDADALRSEGPPIELNIDSQADLLGNEQELRSAFSNLIVNAIRHTPLESSIYVTWRDDQQGVRLDVQDTGGGIAPQHVSRLTERFYRVDDAGTGTKGGTGLGLAIAATEVDAMIPQYQRASGVAGNLSSVGSETLANLMTLWAEAFKREYPNVNIQIQAAGSSTAPPALTEGTSNLGPMSRKMKDKEIEGFQNKYGYKPTPVRVAIDALAVYVNKELENLD